MARVRTPRSCLTGHPRVPRGQVAAPSGRGPRTLLKTASSARGAARAGSHAGSHTDEQLSGTPDPHGQPAGSRPRSRTDLNTAGRPHGHLRIRRSSLRPEGGRVVAWLRSGDGPLSVRARPSSIKRDCDRRATNTGEKRLVNVHAKSPLDPGDLRTLRSEDNGQAAACPDRTRAIPCKQRVVTIQRSTATTADSSTHELSLTPFVSWSSGQPPSIVARSGPKGLEGRCVGKRACRARLVSYSSS